MANISLDIPSPKVLPAVLNASPTDPTILETTRAMSEVFSIVLIVLLGVDEPPSPKKPVEVVIELIYVDSLPV